MPKTFKFLFMFLLLNITFSSIAWGHGAATSKELPPGAKEIMSYALSIESKVGIFEVEFHAQRHQMAYIARLAQILRRDAAKIVEYFGFAPSDTIHITLNDFAISANGFATVFPYNMITLNPIPPLSLDALAENSDWSRGLLLHELTHIIHMDLTRGILKGIRSIFGSVGKLGGITPRWFTEGVAVWAESTFTTSGRLQSQLIDYELESLFFKENFCSSIDCLDDPGVYPGGRNAYWMGSRFIKYLEDKKPKTIRCLIEANSDSIPFFLNSAFNECVGKDASEAFNDFHQKWAQSVESKVTGFSKNRVVKRFTALKPLYGAPLWQAGGSMQRGSFWRMESDEDNKQRLIKYDGKKQSYSAHYIEGYFERIQRGSDFSEKKDELFLSHFRNRGSKRVWKVWNTAKNKITREIAPKKNASYLFQVGENKYYYLSYNIGRWELWLKERELEKKVFTFPIYMNVFSPRVFSDNGNNYLGFQAFISKKNGKEVYAYQIIKLDEKIKANKLWVLYQSSQPFQYLESCGEKHLFKKGDHLLMAELKNGKRVVRETDNALAKEVIQIRWDQKQSHLLLASEPRQTFLSNRGCKKTLRLLLADSAEKIEKRILLRLKDKPLKIDESELEDYPSLSHFKPKYWLLNFQTGDSSSSINISTVLNDPRRHHVFGLGADYYLDLEEVAPSASYTFNGDWASYGVGYSKAFTSNSFSIIPNSAEVASVSIGKNFSFGEWTYNPVLYLSQDKTRDFISNRESIQYGLSQNLNLAGEGGREAFFQNFSLFFDGSYRDVEGRSQFLAIKGRASLNLRWMDRLFSRIMGTYGKLDKFDFSSGVIFGGGYSGYFGASFHEFYGLDYSDAFGNEIITGRFQFDIPFWDTYTGSGLFPAYLKRVHALLGADFIKADRIFVDQAFLFNQNLKSLHAGLKFDLTLAYLAPIQVDLMYARVLNDFGNDENSIFFILQASFF